MAVKMSFRRKGVGTRLLKEIERKYIDMGIRKLSLSADKANPAKKLYEQQGYQITLNHETAQTMVKVLRRMT